MITMTVVKLGPSAATNTRAIKIMGKPRAMSTRRMINASTLPPKYPASRPSVVPIKPLTRMASIDTRSDTLEPWMMRLRTSRPTLSVPRG